MILHHLFEHYDEQKTGPSTFSGPISKAITNCEKLLLVEITSIQPGVALPDINVSDLSKDQRYLLEISKAVRCGNCPEDLPNKNPGPISFSLTHNG